MLNGLRLGNDEEQALLTSHLGAEEVTVPDLIAVRGLLTRLGGRQLTEERAASYVQEAITSLDGSDLPAAVKHRLTEVAESMIGRIQ